MENNVYAVILAGGSGSRLWPLSRSLFPKQLMEIGEGEGTLLQQTARRLLSVFPAENALTVTHKDHRFQVAGQLFEIDKALAENVLAEPVARNTLPAIAWAAAEIVRKSPEAVMGVFPSDHRIADAAAFETACRQGIELAREGRLVTFGLKPDAPETGFGYIQQGEAIGSGPGALVQRFVEKPDAETAAAYLKAGDYLWNSGMFLFKASVFLEQVQRFEPAIFDGVAKLADKEGAAGEIYPNLPKQSIDYGVMERADEVAVIPVEMGWSDLGSWEAVYEEGAKNQDGSVTVGDVFALDAKNSLLMSTKGFVAALGVENLAVIKTGDAVLVSARDRVQEVKAIVEHLQAKGSSLASVHATVNRPWGSYTVLEEGPGYKMKRISVPPGSQLSLQMHHHRSEHWVVVKGTAKVTNNDQVIMVAENESVYIPKTHKHRLENPGVIPLEIIEVQCGEYLEEDDIVRFEDDYGRNSDD